MVDERVTRADRPGFVAVHYLDLDGFKAVNDQYGHAVGDALLTAVSKRITHTLRQSDIAARLGGDEFAIVQCGIAGQQEAASLAQRVIESVEPPSASSSTRSESRPASATSSPSTAPKTSNACSAWPTRRSCRQAFGRRRPVLGTRRRRMGTRAGVTPIIAAKRTRALDFRTALPQGPCLPGRRAFAALIV